MRRNTGLSYEKSRIAVGTVLGCLKDQLPSIGQVMDDVMKNIVHSKVNTLFVPRVQGSRCMLRAYSHIHWTPMPSGRESDRVPGGRLAIGAFWWSGGGVG